MTSMNEQTLRSQVQSLIRENTSLRERASTESSSRLMAEVALGKTEGHLQLAIDAAGLSIWEWEIVDETLFSSADFHESISSLTDLAEGDEALAWSPLDLLRNISPEDRELLRLALVRLFNREDRRMEVEFRVTQGSRVKWMECSGEVTQRDMLGRVERMAGVSRDVTRRREIQQEVETARAQAVAANAAKDEFLAHISHEIRTPLNGVIGMNNLLAQTELDNEQREYVDLVGSSGRALLALVNDVLDYSRLEAHKLMLEQIRFPLRRWLWDVVAPMRVAAQAKGLELLLNAHEALPKEAVGDPGRLRQIVTNLVSNAIKFTEKGHVSVSMAVTRQDAHQFTLEIQVRDTGIGIAAKNQSAIFDAFVQADSSTSRRYGGTGLGLSICARLAHLMGGRIELSSSPGQGSCFTVQVPLTQVNLESPESEFRGTDLSALGPLTGSPALATPANYAGKRALVVDDHSVNQLLATRLLQMRGFEVEVAADGEQALAAIRSKSFDIVFMDIQMPRMDGWQATHHIRQWEQTERKIRVPIIALSAHAAAADREQAMATGMDGYLSKPLTSEALQAALRATGLGRSHSEPGNSVQSVSAAPGAVDLVLPESAPPQAAAAATTVGQVDRDRLLSRLGGDQAAMHDMAQAFCKDLRNCMGAAFEGLQNKQLPAVRSQAHALKGLLLSITAEGAATDARALEQAASTVDQAAAVAAFGRLSVSAKLAFDTVRQW